MNDYTKVFERTRARLGTADLRLEEMYRRRDRKRRNEKIGAIVVALIIALASTAAILNTLGGSRQPTPASETITPGTVSQLQLRWTGRTGGEAPAPIVTNGVAVTETRDGHVVAFPDRCAGDGSACAPLWTADIAPLPVYVDPHDQTITWWPEHSGAPGDPGDVGAFTAANGIVYAGSKTGTIYAFDVRCRTDGGPCDPVWTAQLPHRSGERVGPATGPPLIADGMLLVSVDVGTFAFRVGCGGGGSSCSPVWRIPETGSIRVQDEVLYFTSASGRAYAFDVRTGRPIWWTKPTSCCSNDSTPARYGDTVYVNFGMELDAFPAACRGLCDPTWTAPVTESFSSSPVVVGNVVVITGSNGGSDGGLDSFPIDCTSGGRPCDRWHETHAAADLAYPPPEVSGGRLYAESVHGGGTYVFDPACLARQDDCEPTWSDPRAFSPLQTVIRDGVVYESDNATAVKAFDAGCAANPCAELWHSAIAPDSRVVVEGGEVLFTGHDGVVYAYAPGEPPRPPSKTGAALFYGALALGGAAIVAGRIMRRRRLA